MFYQLIIPYIRYYDKITGKSYVAQVLFKLKIEPSSYTIFPQTVVVDTGKYLDKHFENEELEWSTNRRKAIMLYGLMIRLTNI